LNFPFETSFFIVLDYQLQRASCPQCSQSLQLRVGGVERERLQLDPSCRLGTPASASVCCVLLLDCREPGSPRSRTGGYSPRSWIGDTLEISFTLKKML